MCGKRSLSEMRRKRAKFSRDRRVEFKKSFEFNCQILLKVVTKVCKNFAHFAWTKVKEVKSRLNIMLKKVPFPTNHPSCGNI
jgi:hypothetical protein